ncbi:MAG: alpha/beta fold hydrolase [Pseudonocardiaceae bacterium]
MTRILANGIDMHALRLPPQGVPDADGQHPTVVLVHGFGADSLASFYFTLAAPLSANGIEVIAYDLRGHGRSARPDTGYRLGDFVADLVGLLDALNVSGPVHLVGNSYGGTVAFSYAVAYPERVASLCVIEAEPATELWSRKMSILHDKFRPFEHPDELDRVTAQLGPYATRLVKMTSHKVRITTMVQDTFNGPWLSREQIQSVRCPMMEILGSESDVVDQAELAVLLPHCRTVVVPGQRHLVLMNAPRTVLGLVLSWIAEHHCAPCVLAEAGRG